MRNPNFLKNSFLIGAIALIVLVMMSWVVNARLRGLKMPLPALGNANGSPVPVSQMPNVNGTAAGTAALPVLASAMPPFTGITAWLNSKPLTPDDLKGKVVLIDFWTYSCINCIRTLPYVTSWQQKYGDKGFTVIGVHTPEFAFEKVQSNVEDAIKAHGITYPVAMDNDYGTWNAYNNEYWPAHYLFDAQGRLRATHFGEGDYAQTETEIQELLAEAGTQVQAPVTAIQTGTDLSKVGSPETYVGYGRMAYFGSPETPVHDKAATYTVPANPQQNQFSLGGTWRIESERAVLVNAPGDIVYRFDASNANLVMGTEGTPVRAEVTLDGAPVPAAMRGADVIEDGGKTYATISEQRLYNLIDGKGQYGTHLLRIHFLGTGVECYAFTFG